MQSEPLNEIDNPKPHVTALQAKVFADLATVEDYAQAVGKTERSVWTYIRQGLPVTYIGKSAYVVLSKASQYWVSRTRQRQEPRRPGRPRKN